MAETPYTETEALLKALEDYDADSGNTDTTIDYLIENFLPGELDRLVGACYLLTQAAIDARRGVARRAASA